MQRQLKILTNIFISLGMMIAVMALPLHAFSQPVLKIGEYAGCYNTEVLIPVEIEDFNDVGSFTIYLDGNPEAIEFVGAEDVNDVFSTGTFIAGFNPESQIVLSWVMDFGSPATLENGIMCNLRVLYKSESVNFSFLDNCEIVRSDLSDIGNVAYYDGSLTAFTSYLPNPATQSVLEGNPATILLSDVTEGVSLQWQKKEIENWIDLDDAPPFSGVYTSQLSIESVSADMNGSLFRCKLSNDLCSEGSGVSELLVTPNGVNEIGGQLKVSPMHIYPNPADELLHCLINVDVTNAKLRLISADGIVLFNKQLGDVVSGKFLSLQLEQAKTGIYILQLFSDVKLIAEQKVLRK